ncbi:MAG: FAD-dependent oxidoreductase [Propionibacteriaceae bacterium]|jgi:NADPH-dependent 2,4-dienoyl-CoA reductase/sulfur reductase-like enzyme/rhodanese-related sulfurtransferase|nr:FAD-dependent oxidoreductase [Propionibacteriaceae bacterium]
MIQHRFVIVGGVAGGMSIAARLRRLNEMASITIFERGEHVSIASCGLPYFISGEITSKRALLVQTPESLARSLNLDVRTNHNVIGLDWGAHQVLVATANGRETFEYDTLILAPGALPSRPPIAGLDHPSVHTLRTVEDATTIVDRVENAKRAVVLGGGFIGLEVAEALNHRGLKVTVIEAAPHILPGLETELAFLATEELRRLGIDVHDGIAASSITDLKGQAVVTLADGQTHKADLVILSVGTTPDTKIFEAAGVNCERGFMIVDAHGRTNLTDVYAIGDAVMSTHGVTGKPAAIQLAGPANRAGRLVADALAPGFPARALPGPLGSAIIRIGELTIATTGANRAQLTQAGRRYTTIHTHPADHADYFPGGDQLHMITHIDAESGEILGAQAVGKGGVDKRIDVLATAIRAKLDAPSLIDLDLCYSPPYNSAKDPVNVIGLVADNVLTGTTKLWQPEQLDWARSDQVLLVDVRSPQEYGTGRLPEAINLPLPELRDRLDEIADRAAGRPIALICESGRRSYLAHRILAAAGLESCTFSGGMLTLRAWLGLNAQKILEY